MKVRYLVILVAVVLIYLFIPRGTNEGIQNFEYPDTVLTVYDVIGFDENFHWDPIILDRDLTVFGDIDPVLPLPFGGITSFEAVNIDSTVFLTQVDFDTTEHEFIGGSVCMVLRDIKLGYVDQNGQFVSKRRIAKIILPAKYMVDRFEFWKEEYTPR